MEHYINLTNGIEYLSNPTFKDFNFKFVRIQSTWLEQKNYNSVLKDLDYNFLIDGVTKGVVVYDTSAKKHMPRSLYQGMPFIKYSIDTLLDLPTSNPYVKSHNVRRYFDEVIKDLTSDVKRKILYLERIVKEPKPFNYIGIPKRTSLDGNYEEYREILHAYQNKGKEEA